MAEVRSWADAKIEAWQYLRPTWPTEELGELKIAPWGWESPRSWVVTVVNPVEDGVWLQIDKATGDIQELVWVVWIDQRLRMAPVGTGHPVT